MKQITEVVKFHRRYTFYSARHTYASLGYNLAGFDKYTIHELLNHCDRDMKITERYIERDWSNLFDAHDKIIELIDWAKICKERD
jgi:integrase